MLKVDLLAFDEEKATLTIIADRGTSERISSSLVARGNLGPTTFLSVLMRANEIGVVGRFSASDLRL